MAKQQIICKICHEFGSGEADGKYICDKCKGSGMNRLCKCGHEVGLHQDGGSGHCTVCGCEGVPGAGFHFQSGNLHLGLEHSPVQGAAGNRHRPASELDPRIVQALTIRSALKLYAKTKIQPNRAWTPTAMLNAAGKITGKKYKRGEYLKAADDLSEWAMMEKAHALEGSAGVWKVSSEDELGIEPEYDEAYEQSRWGGMYAYSLEVRGWITDRIKERLIDILIAENASQTKDEMEGWMNEAELMRYMLNKRGVQYEPSPADIDRRKRSLAQKHAKAKRGRLVPADNGDRQPEQSSAVSREMQDITYTFFYDGGHGWLQVPLSHLKALKIADQISSFSYRRDAHAYLEEDEDAGKFIRAYTEAFGSKPRFMEKADGDWSRIRNYETYRA